MATASYYGYGTPEFSIEYTTIPELLNQLADNTSNDIVAQDIRDAVYTIWQKANAVPTTRTYKALIYQSGANAPVVNYLIENTTGIDITFGYWGPGSYYISGTNLFLLLRNSVSLNLPPAKGIWNITRQDNDTTWLETKNTSNISSNDILNEWTLLTIELYF